MTARNKTKIALAVTGVTVLAGCSDEPEVVYKEPTPEMIQAAVDKYLEEQNRENEELKALVTELKKEDPTVHDARYSYVDGERVLKVVHEDPDDSSLTEYIVPVATGAFAGYTGAVLAQKMNESRMMAYNQCEPHIVYPYDHHCYNPYMHQQYSTGTYRGTHWPTVVYDDYDYYNDTRRKDYRDYSQRQAKVAKTQAATIPKSAQERAKEVRKKYNDNRLASNNTSSNRVLTQDRNSKSNTVTSTTKTQTSSGYTVTSNTQAKKTNTYKKPEPKLETKRKAFKPKKTVRRSSFSWGG